MHVRVFATDCAWKPVPNLTGAPPADDVCSAAMINPEPAAIPLPPAPLRLTLPENNAGRDFIVCDIHGHFDALTAALAARGFDNSCDRVITVGDLIDRGPDSSRALEFLAQPWFFSVRGNHEQAMLGWLNLLMADAPTTAIRDAAARHTAFGGAWILPLLTRALRGERAEAEHWQRTLNALPLAIVIPRRGERIGVVHATVPGGDWSLLDNDRRLLEPLAPAEQAVLWHRRPLDDAPQRSVRGIDRVYVGHNVVPRPTRIGNLHMIETAVWAGNALTVIDLDADENAKGKSLFSRLFDR